MVEIGLGGISGRQVLTQVWLAYLALAFLTGTVRAAITHGIALSALGAGIMGALGNVGSVLVTAVSLYLVAQFVRPSIKFLPLTHGLAFVSLVGGILFLALVPVMLLLVLVGGIEFAVVVAVASFVVALILLMLFVIGVFDVGCIGGVFLGLIAALITSAVGAALSAAFHRLTGA
jgi:hypothetical protein